MIVETGKLLDGTEYREFVVIGDDDRERFSARLIAGSKTLEIGWTDNLPWTLRWLREIFVSCGGYGTITIVEGMATDKLERMIKQGEFQQSRVAKLLSKFLGGNWEIEIVTRASGIFDVTAKQMESNK